MTKEELMQLRMLREIDAKVSKHHWWSDFSSNIAGNAVWDGALWLASRVLRKL